MSLNNASLHESFLGTFLKCLDLMFEPSAKLELKPQPHDRGPVKEQGELGLHDSRGKHSGRPLQLELTLAEKNTRLEAQIHLLQAKNELLKKIRLAELGGTTSKANT
jgi:hypothetical protein